MIARFGSHFVKQPNKTEKLQTLRAQFNFEGYDLNLSPSGPVIPYQSSLDNPKVWSTVSKAWEITICMENPEIPGRVQMERFIPVEIFRKTSTTFRGITFFPFLTTRPTARLHLERERKIYRYFVNGKQNTSTIWPKFFHRNCRTNGKHSLFEVQ